MTVSKLRWMPVTDDQFVIMARTDALANEGLEAGIARAQAYVAAGADMIFAEAVTELTAYSAFAMQWACPFWRTSPSLGKTPLFTREELGSRRRRHRPLLLRGVSRHERRRAAGL